MAVIRPRTVSRLYAHFSTVRFLCPPGVGVGRRGGLRARALASLRFPANEKWTTPYGSVPTYPAPCGRGLTPAAAVAFTAGRNCAVGTVKRVDKEHFKRALSPTWFQNAAATTDALSADWSFDRQRTGRHRGGHRTDCDDPGGIMHLSTSPALVTGLVHTGDSPLGLGGPDRLTRLCPSGAARWS
jgi:hypothetical protein